MGCKLMKTYLLNAALKQGMTNKTEITASGWGKELLVSLVSPRTTLRKMDILDWFHIAKKYQTVRRALGAEFEEALESSKWTLWHGR